MKANVNAVRGRSSRTHVSKLTLTAENEVDQVELAILATARFPFGDDRDKRFDAWRIAKLAAYCKKNKLTLVRTD